MTSGRRERLALIAALCSALLLAGPALAQETQCVQHEPEEGDHAEAAEDYIAQGRKQETAREARGYFAYALDLLKRGIAEEPDNPLHYYLAGQVSVELNDHIGADSLWDRAACLWTPYAETIDGFRFIAWGNALRGAQELVSSGDTLGAIQAYRNAYAINDREPHPIFQFASHRVTQAQLVESDSLRQAYLEDAVWGFREAAAATRRSDTLSEDERRDFVGSATANVAQILAYQDRLLEAAEVYEDYLTEYPDDAQARSRLASFLAMRINELQRSVEQTEDPAMQEELRARIDSLGEMASSQYTELLAMEGVDLEADEYHDMGIGLYQLEKWEGAALAFRKALEQQPYRPESLELLAHSLYAGERYDTLVTVAEQLVDRYPHDVGSLALLANAYREMERPEEALEVFERREALPLGISELDLHGGAATGWVANLKLEPGTPIEIEFTFYDDAGNIIGGGGLSIAAPAEGDRTPFRVTPEAPTAEASGITYRVVQPT
jgi:tetratricopeptide (TPR) repeat protein